MADMWVRCLKGPVVVGGRMLYTGETMALTAVTLPAAQRVARERPGMVVIVGDLTPDPCPGEAVLPAETRSMADEEPEHELTEPGGEPEADEGQAPTVEFVEPAPEGSNDLGTRVMVEPAKRKGRSR
jgi:hypothetical protein